MSTWININVINAYVENIFIYEDDNNTPKENVQPPITIP